MKRVSCLFSICLALVPVQATPAPVPRGKDKAFTVEAGAYDMIWNNTRWRFELAPCGACNTYSASATTWRGHWRWQATTKTLTVSEKRISDDGTSGDLHVWAVDLDEKGSGKAAYVNGRADISFVIERLPIDPEPLVRWKSAK